MFLKTYRPTVGSITIMLFLVEGYFLYTIVVVFAIHGHESAMDLHVNNNAS